MAVVAAALVALVAFVTPPAAAPAADHEPRTWKRCGTLPYSKFELRVRGKRVTCREARLVEAAFGKNGGAYGCSRSCIVRTYVCKVEGYSFSRYAVICRKPGGTVTWKVDYARPQPPI